MRKKGNLCHCFSAKLNVSGPDFTVSRPEKNITTLHYCVRAQLHLCPGQNCTTAVRVSGRKRDVQPVHKEMPPPSPCDMFSRAFKYCHYKLSERLGTSIQMDSECTVCIVWGKLAPELVGVHSEQDPMRLKSKSKDAGVWCPLLSYWEYWGH